MKQTDVAARRVLVSGRVQGVAFRWYTLEEARGLGLAGWVRNLPDGRVEVQCQGRTEDVSTLLAWLEQGPPAARVSGIDVHSVAPEEHQGFDIR